MGPLERSHHTTGGLFIPDVMKILIVLLMTAAVFAQAPAAVAGKDARLPNPKLTPGAVRTTSAKAICAQGFSTKSVRNVPQSEKNAVYKSYGIAPHKNYCSGAQGCEVDHLISLELGGSNDISNLWPQPYDEHPGAHEKDKLENWLHKQVCTGKMKLPDAQKAIATDWLAEYRKMPQ